MQKQLYALALSFISIDEEQLCEILVLMKGDMKTGTEPY
jgi:hypothetical protein